MALIMPKKGLFQMIISKKIFKILWTFFSILLIASLKLIAAILCIPIVIIKILIYIMGSWISYVGYLIAGILTLLLIIGWNSFSGDYAILDRLIFLLLIFITGGLPYLITVYGIIFLEFVQELLGIFILQVPFTILSASKNDIYEQYFEETYKNYDHSKSNNTSSSETSDDTSHAKNSSNFFKGVTNNEQLKKRYKDLLKIYHPDNQAGDTTISQEIQDEYEQLLKQYE